MHTIKVTILLIIAHVADVMLNRKIVGSAFTSMACLYCDAHCLEVSAHIIDLLLQDQVSISNLQFNT